jgi:hypothetical protein
MNWILDHGKVKHRQMPIQMLNKQAPHPHPGHFAAVNSNEKK